MNALFVLEALIVGILCPVGEAKQDTPASLENVSKRFQIEIVRIPTKIYPVKNRFGIITGEVPTEASLKKYTPVLARELSKYPTPFLEKTNLKRIVLAQGLQYDGQERAGVPDFQNQTLHLDVEQGNWNKLYQESVIHHELFHVVDWKDDGKIYDDKKWKKLNPDRFEYGSGGKNARGKDQWPLDNTLRGFLNKYSMSGVEEDKAEIYANMIVRPGVVRKRARKDPVIAKKITAMKRLLHDFSPSMDRNFWVGLER